MKEPRERNTRENWSRPETWGHLRLIGALMALPVLGAGIGVVLSYAGVDWMSLIFGWVNLVMMLSAGAVVWGLIYGINAVWLRRLSERLIAGMVMVQAVLAGVAAQALVQAWLDLPADLRREWIHRIHSLLP